MIRRAFSPVFVGKTRYTPFPVLLILLLIPCLLFWVKEAPAITWQDQGPTPLFDGEVVILAPPDKPADKNPVTGAIQSLVLHPTDAKTIYIGAVNGGIGALGKYPAQRGRRRAIALYGRG